MPAIEKAPAALIRTAAAMEKQLSTAQKSGLGVSTIRALLFINNHGNPALSALTRHLGVSSAAVTGLADRLVKQGHAVRLPDSQDRRLHLIELTDKGVELVRQILAA